MSFAAQVWWEKDLLAAVLRIFKQRLAASLFDVFIS